MKDLITDDSDIPESGIPRGVPPFVRYVSAATPPESSFKSQYLATPFTDPRYDKLRDIAYNFHKGVEEWDEANLTGPRIEGLKMPQAWERDGMMRHFYAEEKEALAEVEKLGFTLQEWRIVSLNQRDRLRREIRRRHGAKD